MKRRRNRLAALICALACCMMICSPIVRAGDLPPVPLTTKKTRVAGDANQDNKVNLHDVVAIERNLAGGWGVSIDTSNADVNGDKTVDLKDVVLLRRYIAGGWGVTLK